MAYFSCQTLILHVVHYFRLIDWLVHDLCAIFTSQSQTYRDWCKTQQYQIETRPHDEMILSVRTPKYLCYTQYDFLAHIPILTWRQSTLKWALQFDKDIEKVVWKYREFIKILKLFTSLQLGKKILISESKFCATQLQFEDKTLTPSARGYSIEESQQGGDPSIE